MVRALSPEAPLWGAHPQLRLIPTQTLLEQNCSLGLLALSGPDLDKDSKRKRRKWPRSKAMEEPDTW